MCCKLLIYKRIYQIGGGQFDNFRQKRECDLWLRKSHKSRKKEADAARRRPYQFDVDGRFTDQE